MRPWRVVFMGTPAFAVPVLQALLAGEDPVVGVITRPDKPVGRGLNLQPPPVKEVALAHAMPVLQPVRLRESEAVAQLRVWQPDVAVVAAYGQILSPEVLAIPTHGCLNVHASLLPRWRGADPIRHAILAGDAATGVTIMRMDEGLDTGPILATATLAMADTMTGGELYQELSTLGASLLMRTLADLKAGLVSAMPQPAMGITYAGKVDASLCQLAWQESAHVLLARIRAFAPTPGAFTRLRQTTVKILDATPGPGQGEAGRVIGLHQQGPEVACGAGSLILTQVQPAGKRRMTGGDWLRGRPLDLGELLP